MVEADEAAVLGAEVQEYPDQRGEILLEAAAAWRRAGSPERADALLAELIAVGGEDGCCARFQRAENHFADGADELAYAELACLERDPALNDGHCTWVAEMLTERGDLDGALRWYDRAVARLAPEEFDALRGPDGWMRLSSMLVGGRREVRRRLGLPADATDEVAPVAPWQRPLDVDGVLQRVESGLVPAQVRMLVFQRGERAAARRRWPQEYDASDEEYYPAAERRWRELADSGVPTIRVVPATVGELCAFADRVGGSPTDSTVKQRYAATVDAHRIIAWPPPRNGACWCGSSAKYKRCCGRPA